MEDAGLHMEMGMLNMCMAMVTARAQMVKDPHTLGLEYPKCSALGFRV
jgi:hypothetical protein